MLPWIESACQRATARARRRPHDGPATSLQFRLLVRQWAFCGHAVHGRHTNPKQEGGGQPWIFLHVLPIVSRGGSEHFEL